MKIIGGSFGVAGSAYFSSDGYLVVEGAVKNHYKPAEVLSAEARVDKEKGWSVFNLLLGFLVLTPFLMVLGWLFVPLGGVVGFIGGVVLTLVFSRVESRNNVVNVAFHSGDYVVLDCTPRQVKKLMQFKAVS